MVNRCDNENRRQPLAGQNRAVASSAAEASESTAAAAHPLAAAGVAQRMTHRPPAGMVAVLALVSALAAGLTLRPEAAAEVRRSAPKEHFKSGAQRSEVLLAEILATLQRMDAKLGRIEKQTEAAAAMASHAQANGRAP